MGGARVARSASRQIRPPSGGGGGGGAGGEFRSSLRIQRATRGLDCNITLYSKTGKAEMRAGGFFSLLGLCNLLDWHGPALRYEGDGPDAEHAFKCIADIMRGEKTTLTDDDCKVLARQGCYSRAILEDLPPIAAARWINWLREDPERRLPFKDEPLPPEHRSQYPYMQAYGGFLPLKEYRFRLKALPADVKRKFKCLDNYKQNEYLLAPEDVQREMIASIPDPEPPVKRNSANTRYVLPNGEYCKTVEEFLAQRDELKGTANHE